MAQRADCFGAGPEGKEKCRTCWFFKGNMQKNKQTCHSHSFLHVFCIFGWKYKHFLCIFCILGDSCLMAQRAHCFGAGPGGREKCRKCIKCSLFTRKIQKNQNMCHSHSFLHVFCIFGWKYQHFMHFLHFWRFLIDGLACSLLWGRAWG